MYGIEGDTVGGRNQNTADQFHMPTENLTDSSELFPGQPILARRLDKTNAQEATLGVARRFAVSNTAAASKRSTGSTYPPCSCGPHNVLPPVSPGSKQANLLSLSPREHSKNFMPPVFGNEQPHSGPFADSVPVSEGCRVVNQNHGYSQNLGRQELSDRRLNAASRHYFLQGNAQQNDASGSPQ